MDDLMFIIKSDSKSTFKNSIDILDEMSIALFLRVTMQRWISSGRTGTDPANQK